VSSTRRPILLAFAPLAATIVLAACGSEGDAGTSPVTSAPPPSPVASAPGTRAPLIDHPTGAHQPVVRLVEAGGIGPEGSDFESPPSLLVLGDGTVIRPGPQIQVYPGPMLAALTVARLDEAGLQALLARAQADGLLTMPPPPYDEPPGRPQVADPPATTLELDAGGGRVVHRAYGLAPSGTESTPARERLARFVAGLHDLAGAAGSHLGPDERYRPARLGVIARPATPGELGPDDEGATAAVRRWPDAAGSLARSGGRCVEVPVAAAGPTLAAASTGDRFSQGGTTYVVYVRVLLPGETCSQFP